MKSIKELWNSIIKSIEIRDNQQYIDEIFELENNIKKLNARNGELVQASLDLTDTRIKLEAEIIAYQTEVDFLNNEIATLKASQDKHKTLQTFLDWSSKNIPKSIQYHYTQKGRIRPHTILKITDKEKVFNFAKECLNLKNFKTADDLVYHFNIVFDKKYPTAKYYEYDSEAWGVKEYWETPEEVIDLIRRIKKYSDCDSVAILKWACLTVLLNYYFPNWDERRLRMFLVRIFRIGGGHAICGWIKEGVNDWIPIETTYYNDNFKDVWEENMTFRSNTLAYKIMCSFDDKNEYVKI